VSDRSTAPGTLVIGIDTGGTYTDAVILDSAASPDLAVLASSKALTTKGDLSIGVSEALGAVLQKFTDGAVADIQLVTVSTTLATNAVVEGHGGKAAIVLIGFDDAMAERTGIGRAFSDVTILRIDGGHSSSGHEVRRLDVDALKVSISLLAPDIEAIAVSSLFSVRNPSHERNAASMIRDLTGLPVTESVDLSSSLDAPRRAATALLNARLIGKISALINAVERSMASVGLVCPLMVVKGDGSRALASSVRHAPVDTIMSGPAASTVGAGYLSGLRDFVMSDMGGTTTDTSLVVNGRPRLSPDGAVVGGWRTMVAAMDVRTVGLGGDSRVSIEHRSDGRSITLGPNRIIPLSLLASRDARVVDALQRDLTEPVHEHAGRFLAAPFGTDRLIDRSSLSGAEQTIVALVNRGPRRWNDVVTSARTGRSVEQLIRMGLLVESGLTPSDVAHALGRQSIWSEEAARLGLDVAVAKSLTPLRADELAKEVWSATVTASARAIIDVCLASRHVAQFDSDLIDAVTSGDHVYGHLKVSFSPTLDVVAVGGPAALFYPEVGDRLGCRVTTPPFAQVANAVGAAVGVVSRTVVVTVTRDEVEGFVASASHENSTYISSEAAIVWARNRAETDARESVDQMGGAVYQCTVDCTRTYLPGRTDDDALLTATVTAEAIGTPR
jgi:N-methylhydantoinase A/oxoprolinase/acetone carboxylase beta subunit